MTPTDDLSVHDLAEIVGRIVQKPAPLRGWYDDGGGCIDFSLQLQRALEEELVFTERRLGCGHVSLRYPRRRKEPVYLDSTYLQFFDNSTGRLPHIVLGVGESIALMVQEELQRGTASTFSSGAEFVQRCYVDTMPYIDEETRYWLAPGWEMPAWMLRHMKTDLPTIGSCGNGLE
jgi:hypothetical protein